jgi:hypothetical protein
VLEVAALCLKMSHPPREKQKKEKAESHRRGESNLVFLKKHDRVMPKIKMRLYAQIPHIVEFNIDTQII